MRTEPALKAPIAGARSWELAIRKVPAERVDYGSVVRFAVRVNATR